MAYPKLLIPNFRLSQTLNPIPSLPVNIDNLNGIIRTVSGGRVIVDFNHPLSGRVLSYNVKVNKP